MAQPEIKLDARYLASIDADVYNKVCAWLQHQAQYKEANPPETWSPAPPVTPPPKTSPRSSPRFSPYFVPNDKPRSPVIYFDRKPRPRSPSPDDVLPPPPPPPATLPTTALPPISELLKLPPPPAPPVLAPEPVVRDSPESPNSESWKYDPIFSWQLNVGYTDFYLDNQYPNCCCAMCMSYKPSAEQRPANPPPAAPAQEA